MVAEIYLFCRLCMYLGIYPWVYDGKNTWSTLVFTTYLEIKIAFSNHQCAIGCTHIIHTSGYPWLCQDIGTPMRFLLLCTFFSSSKALHLTIVVDQCSILSLIFFSSLSTLNQHLHGCILNCTLRQLIIQVQRMGWIRQHVNFRNNKKSPRVPGRAWSAFCDGPELHHRRTDVVIDRSLTMKRIVLPRRQAIWFRHGQSKSGSPGVPGRARSAFCDGARLHHGRT
jgi:hypothetical protein